MSINSGHDRKTFQIEPQKKTFEIGATVGGLPTGYDSNRSRVVTLPEIGREIVFTTQGNSVHDCGPCLALNICSVLQNDSQVRTIDGVRRMVNQKRISGGRPTLADENLMTDDVRFFLERQNTEVEIVSANDEAQQDYLQRIRQRFEGWKVPYVVFTGSSGHFKGIYVENKNFYLIDSLASQPTRVTEDRVLSMIKGAAESTRKETVAIAWAKRP